MPAELLAVLFAFFSLVIFLVHTVLAVSVVSAWARDRWERRRRGAGPRVPVSVIVVAKDEEGNLPELLESLDRQSVRDFEVVLVNDRSTDGTARIMEEYRRSRATPVQVVHNSRDPGAMNPKQFALDFGVEASSGEILLFTDADCTLPPGWVENLLAYFCDARVGVVFGQLRLRDTGSFLGRYQGYDQPLIHQYSSGIAALGMPGSCFGNNLGARRAVIQELGGFRALGDTLTEDAALLAAASALRPAHGGPVQGGSPAAQPPADGWRIRVSTLQETTITTLPQESWRDFVHQHVRWNSGGFFHQDLKTRASYRFVVLYLVAGVVGAPFAFLFPPVLMLAATAFVSIGMLGLLSGLLYGEDRAAFLVRLVPYNLFFMLFYSFVTVLSILRVSPVWKGRRLGGRRASRG